MITPFSRVLPHMHGITQKYISEIMGSLNLNMTLK